MGMLSNEERARLIPAELAANPTPIPTSSITTRHMAPLGSRYQE